MSNKICKFIPLPKKIQPIFSNLVAVTGKA